MANFAMKALVVVFGSIVLLILVGAGVEALNKACNPTISKTEYFVTMKDEKDGIITEKSEVKKSTPKLSPLAQEISERLDHKEKWKSVSYSMITDGRITIDKSGEMVGRTYHQCFSFYIDYIDSEEVSNLLGKDFGYLVDKADKLLKEMRIKAEEEEKRQKTEHANQLAEELRKERK